MKKKFNLSRPYIIPKNRFQSVFWIATLFYFLYEYWIIQNELILILLIIPLGMLFFDYRDRSKVIIDANGITESCNKSITHWDKIKCCRIESYTISKSIHTELVIHKINGTERKINTDNLKISHLIEAINFYAQRNVDLFQLSEKEIKEIKKNSLKGVIQLLIAAIIIILIIILKKKGLF